MPKFQPSGLLAVDPRALGQDFDAPSTPSNLVSGVALEFIRGPLYHHPSPEAESYASVVGRVTTSLASDASAVVLVIDSPGGLVSGLFDSCRTLVAAAAESGKPLIAFVDGQACSAAYALAAACSKIYVSDTAALGSIGVIEVLLDVTENDRREGFKYGVVTSGKRKADGHPHVAMTTESLAVSQKNVDYLAGRFFDFVAEQRGIPRNFVRGLEAATFTGGLAVENGLADRVAMLDDVLSATILGQELPGTQTPAQRAERVKAIQRAKVSREASRIAAAVASSRPVSYGPTPHQIRMASDPAYRRERARDAVARFCCGEMTRENLIRWGAHDEDFDGIGRLLS